MTETFLSPACRSTDTANSVMLEYRRVMVATSGGSRTAQYPTRDVLGTFSYAKDQV